MTRVWDSAGRAAPAGPRTPSPRPQPCVAHTPVLSARGQRSPSHSSTLPSPKAGGAHWKRHVFNHFRERENRDDVAGALIRLQNSESVWKVSGRSPAQASVFRTVLNEPPAAPEGPLGPDLPGVAGALTRAQTVSITGSLRHSARLP